MNGNKINNNCFVRTKLYLLSKCTFIQQFIRRVDYLFYQNLVEVLIPDVLRPIPSKCIVLQHTLGSNCDDISAFDSMFLCLSSTSTVVVVYSTKKTYLLHGRFNYLKKIIANNSIKKFKGR